MFSARFLVPPAGFAAAVSCSCLAGILLHRMRLVSWCRPPPRLPLGLGLLYSCFSGLWTVLSWLPGSGLFLCSSKPVPHNSASWQQSKAGRAFSFHHVGLPFPFAHCKGLHQRPRWEGGWRSLAELWASVPLSMDRYIMWEVEEFAPGSSTMLGFCV